MGEVITAWVGLGFTIVVNFIMLAYFGGRFTSKQESLEAEVTKLESKIEKLSSLQPDIAAIKVTLEIVQRQLDIFTRGARSYNDQKESK